MWQNFLVHSLPFSARMSVSVAPVLLKNTMHTKVLMTKKGQKSYK